MIYLFFYGVIFFGAIAIIYKCSDKSDVANTTYFNGIFDKKN